MTSLLYVRNLSYDATHDQVLDLFTRAGEVSAVYMITDRWTAMPKGFGFVQMATATAANKAVKLFNGMKWLNGTLIVRVTTEDDQMLGGILSGKYNTVITSE